MPDADDPRGRGPLGWGDAFAALPQETPPADAWSRLAARLDARTASVAEGSASATAAPATTARESARRHRGRRSLRFAGWIGAATAAALALVVAWPGHAPPPSSTPDAAVATTARPSAATPSGAPAPATTLPTPAPGTATTVAASPRKPGADATAIALPKAVEASRKPRYAARQAPARATPAEAQPLDALYAESARLEALLAMARDERVATAGAALLSAELDAQVAAIDARLAQPGLDAARRTLLWQARVDALRQAAGFESTQRVLASQGDGGALLVSVD